MSRPLPVARAGALPYAARWLDACAGVVAPSPGEVGLWLLEPSADDRSEIETSLSPPERERLARIQHPRALAELLAGRRLIRVVLGALCGLAPAAVPIVEGERGALALDPALGAPWRFNLSHTDGLVALAVSTQRVGVDVEWLLRPGRTVELAERYFAKAEVAALRALPAERQRDRFFELWTLKEAYIKARGLGLAIPLGAFAYDLEPPIRLSVDPSVRDCPDASWSFALADLALGPDPTPTHRLALAMGSDPDI